MRTIVACFGNVLRGDDGFGPAVGRYLLESPVPDDIYVFEVGIGGIHLVQELLEPAEILVVVDAVDLGRAPGTVMVIEPDIMDVTTLSASARRDQLADMHYATPERALMLARAMDVLPSVTWLVGCQPRDADRVGEGLSDVVSEAVATGAEETRAVIRAAGVAWS